MPTYIATREFNFGAIRQTLKQGDTVDVSGDIVLFRGTQYKVPGVHGIIGAGILKEAGSDTAIVVAQNPQAMVLRAPDSQPPPKAKPDKPAPAHLEPDKPHIWISDGLGINSNTCKVCGCTRTGGGLWGNIRADKPSMPYQYTDAYGVSIQSMHDLPCPLFIGDMGGAVAGTTHRVRKLKGQVEHMDTRVETMDDRLNRLELENIFLREQSARRQEVALSLLGRLVAAAEQLPAGEARTLLLPDHGEIIDILEVEELEKVPVEGSILEETA